MRIPTAEQRIVLEHRNDRVRIVRACPGSGKTWLVAELIRDEIAHWPRTRCGIAALSFTRVGGEEIRRALGYELGHPHFVGTIDAFLFRFVVRPFFQRVFPGYASPRILAAESGAEYWKYYAHKKNAALDNGKIKLFGCVFIGETPEHKAVVAHKPHVLQPLCPLSAADAEKVKDAKNEVWKKHGLLTHSDAALVASKILEHPKFGALVRAELIRRFPFLVVDELQDTGHFLGKSIRMILSESTARGVLVGDPDQAIFEFNGARPDLFNTFENIVGAVPLNLASSQRCPPAVATAASHLKDSIGTIGPAQNRTGRALLVRYKEMLELPELVKAIRASRAGGTLKVIARGTSTVDELAGRRVGIAPNLRCPTITHVHRAVVAFRQSKNTSALACIRAGLERSVFQYEGVSDEDLTMASIEPLEWKKFAVRCLLKANTIQTRGTFLEWQTEVGKMIEGEVVNCGLGSTSTFVTGKLKPKDYEGSQDPSATFVPQLGTDDRTLSGIEVQTVHSVKGETHDVTIFVCPTTGKAEHCPSAMWWSPDEKDREERRIAYVAMTRTNGDLLFCVSEACYKRLLAKRAAFVGSFNCLTVTECIALLGRDSGQIPALTEDGGVPD